MPVHELNRLGLVVETENPFRRLRQRHDFPGVSRRPAGRKRSNRRGQIGRKRAGCSQAQLLSYLKLSHKRVGLLINFNVAHLRQESGAGFVVLKKDAVPPLARNAVVPSW